MNKYSWGISPIPKSTWNLIDSHYLDLVDSFFSPKSYKTDFPVNIFYDKDEEGASAACVIEVALAGVSKDRIKVSLTSEKDIYLSIDVGKKEETREMVYKGTSDKKWHVSYSMSEFHDVENITSEFVDGLLKVRIPIRKAPEPETKVKEILVK